MTQTTKNKTCFGFIGLGLIGGSIAKSIKRVFQNNATIIAYDINQDTLSSAKEEGVIDIISPQIDKTFTACDFLFLCAPVSFNDQNLLFIRDYLSADCILTDVGSVKTNIHEQIHQLQLEHCFIGGHPMAGRQFSGIDYASPTLFNKASMILVPEENTECPKVLAELFEQIGCYITITTKEEHDAMIAYTSQLAHVVSNAYVKSPASEKHKGFSAGSYMDLTRVAYLNPDMWTELFLENADNLTNEIDFLIDNLVKINKAIKERDADTIRQLLKEGADIKKRVDM